MVSEGQKKLTSLNILKNTVQNVKLDIMRQVKHACILFILTYRI